MKNADRPTSSITAHARTALFRWLSAILTSALIALAAAGIALAMWRVAYRPVQ